MSGYDVCVRHGDHILDDCPDSGGDGRALGAQGHEEARANTGSPLRLSMSPLRGFRRWRIVARVRVHAALKSSLVDGLCRPLASR
jgi:hypothetical protein